ncbi:EAL domain-containing protein [uncultured Ferrimonas sp.]|uniref:EAL domain-containing protein n=1 Tax=uncultured Ferrimonas sp. TaxID=432640 RepID=UPI002627C5FC|nr:EAL domain-containing protein [uncultured Ferrimonas sp.]
MTLLNKMVLRLALANVCLLLLVLGAFALLQYQSLQQQQQRYLTQQSDYFAANLKPALIAADKPLIRTIMADPQPLSRLANGRLELASGELLWRQDGPFIPTLHSHSVLLEQQLRPLASLSFSTNPQWIHAQLWQQCRQLAVALIAALVLVNALSLLLLQKLLKPLQSLSSQAQAISQQQAVPALDCNSTVQEFNHIGYAIKVMSRQMNQLITEQADRTDKIRQRLYHDPLSGLGNRLLLQSSMETWIKEGNCGVLILLHMPSLSDSRKLGHESGYRSQCHKLEQQIQQMLALTHHLTLVRLHEHELGLLITDILEDELQPLGQKLVNMVSQTAEQLQSKDLARHKVVMLFSVAPHDPSAMMAKLDNLLAKNTHQDHRQAIIRQHNQQGMVRGRRQWVELVESAITQHQVVLRQQAALSPDGSLLHYEVLSQLLLTGESCSAGQFIPALEATGFIAEFDKYVVTQVFTRIGQRNKGPVTAINLSAYSLSDPGFLRWLKHQLLIQTKLKEKVVFEIPEAAFFHQREESMLACELIDAAGFHFAIDHFGRHLQEISYLTELPPPQYVKLDYLYSQRLHEEQQRELLAALCRTTQNLGLVTIATRVENTDQLSLFQQLNVDGIQGYISYNWEEARHL